MTRTRPISVAVVDDEWANHWAVRLLATAHPSIITVTSEASHPREVLALPETPDVVLLDVYVGNDDDLTIAAIPDLIAQGSAVLLNTKERAPARLLEAMRLGASGLVMKSEGPTVLLDAIQSAARGDAVIMSVLAHAMVHDQRCAELTLRERDVITLIADGLEYGPVGIALSISPETVKKHVSSIAARYGALNRAAGRKATVARAIEDGHVRIRRSPSPGTDGHQLSP